jgi:hypothetical protein
LPSRFRHERLDQIGGRAHGAGAGNGKARVITSGSDESDRCVPRSLLAADQLGGLKPVKPLHLDAEQDGDEVLLKGPAKCFVAVPCADKLLLSRGEERGEGSQATSLVVG